MTLSCLLKMGFMLGRIPRQIWLQQRSLLVPRPADGTKSLKVPDDECTLKSTCYGFRQHQPNFSLSSQSIVESFGSGRPCHRRLGRHSSWRSTISAEWSRCLAAKTNSGEGFHNWTLDMPQSEASNCAASNTAAIASTWACCAWFRTLSVILFNAGWPKVSSPSTDRRRILRTFSSRFLPKVRVHIHQIFLPLGTSATAPLAFGRRSKSTLAKNSSLLWCHFIVAASGISATRTSDARGSDLAISYLRFASSVLQSPSTSSEVKITPLGKLILRS